MRRVLRRSARGLAAAAAFLAWGGCAEEQDVWFRETARERGIDFVHVRARERRFWFPEIMGGGVALLDYDEDGWLDLYLVQSGDLAEPGDDLADRLYHNAGAGRFADVSARSGIVEKGYGMGCISGDADGDGDVDLYVTNVGPNALYRNEGNGTFADVTEAAGVGEPNWGTSAVFADYDADGDLDLFVANYVRWSPEVEMVCRAPYDRRDYCSPKNYEAPTRDTLYRNEGDGTFSDVSAAAGLGAAFGNGLGVTTGDFEGDGRLDFYVANDLMPNQLWQNQGDGTFVDRALIAGCAVNIDGMAQAGMGVVSIDVEQDGDLDLFITHLRGETNTLYVNRAGAFSDGTARSGLGAASLPFTGFGTGIADFDHDGTLDVYVANGAVTRNRVPFDPDDPYAEPGLLQRGAPDASGGVRWEAVEPAGGVDPPSIGNARGAAFGDVDNDGDVDVVLCDNDARARLLENVRADGHWVELWVREASGAPAHDAAVRVEAGGRAFHRPVQTGGSYCASNDPRVHVGLGGHSAPVDVLVRWIDGAEERFGPLALDAIHQVRRGTGTAVER